MKVNENGWIWMKKVKVDENGWKRWKWMKMDEKKMKVDEKDEKDESGWAVPAGEHRSTEWKSESVTNWLTD